MKDIVINKIKEMYMLKVKETLELRESLRLLQEDYDKLKLKYDEQCNIKQ